MLSHIQDCQGGAVSEAIQLNLALIHSIGQLKYYLHQVIHHRQPLFLDRKLRWKGQDQLDTLEGQDRLSCQLLGQLTPHWIGSFHHIPQSQLSLSVLQIKSNFYWDIWDISCLIKAVKGSETFYSFLRLLHRDKNILINIFLFLLQLIRKTPITWSWTTCLFSRHTRRTGRLINGIATIVQGAQMARFIEGEPLAFILISTLISAFNFSIGI